MHAYIIGELKDQMPRFFGKEDRKRELIDGLSVVYRKIQAKHGISPGDFPDLVSMQRKLMVRHAIVVGSLVISTCSCYNTAL